MRLASKRARATQAASAKTSGYSFARLEILSLPQRFLDETGRAWARSAAGASREVKALGRISSRKQTKLESR